MNYGEADRILTVFTERLGKIKVLAKGVRKISSRLAGNLEPYNHLNLDLHSGKTFYTVTSAEILECLDCDKKLSISNQAVYLAEVVDKAFEEEEKAATAFNIFLDCLRLIGSGDDNELALRSFELKILQEAGFRPDLFHCAKCKRELAPGGNYLSVAGDLQCRECAEATSENMPDNVLKLLRLLQEREADICLRLKCQGGDLRIAERYLDQLLQNALEREIKSKKYLS